MVALATMALAFTACSGRTNSTMSKIEDVTKASPTSMTTSSAPTPTLVPGGWGNNPPNRHAIEEMAQWASVSISDVKAAFHDSSNAIDRFDTLQNSPDINAAKAQCQDMAQPVDIKLAAHVPTPDLDLTNAFRVVIDDARNVATSCAKALTDPSTPNKTLFDASVDTLRSDFDTAGDIMIRDGKILTAAGF